MSNIGHNIKACRERANMTQQQLALKVRVGTGTIAKYENGDQIPDTQTVLRISTALDIPASELLEQELQKGQSGIDYEIEQLVREIGTKKQSSSCGKLRNSVRKISCVSCKCYMK